MPPRERRGEARWHNPPVEERQPRHTMAISSGENLRSALPRQARFSPRRSLPRDPDPASIQNQMGSRKRLLFLALLIVPVTAHAHTGAGPLHGFLDGAQHPLSGLDHLLAMIAVGLWAAQTGGRALWAVPTSFVALMAVGGILGMTGFHPPFVETGILVSVLGLGLLILFAIRLPVAAGMLIVGAFAMFHGFAHGAEMPTQASSAAYAIGFVLSTAALHLAGIALGIALGRVRFAPLLRVAGACVLLGGLAVALS